jgi:hypothetical protein
LRQDLERLLEDLRSTISDVFGGRQTALTNLRDVAKFQRPDPEYDRGFAMQDMFDLSLTWDDLKFLRTAHILPLAAIEPGGQNKPRLC